MSAVSLIGGASLGPEQALGSIGGGAGSWVSRRRRLGSEDSQVNTLAGFGGAYGGLFSSTVIVVMMIMEVARPGGRQFTKALVGAVVASSVSFAVYFAIAGSVFLDAYPVPRYQFEDWQLLAAVPLGLFAAVVTTLLGTFVKLSAMLFDRLKLPGVVKSTLGGAIFGLVGVALPLTLFTGSDQLNTVLSDAGTLGLGLLIALLIGKMLTFGVSQASGFIGGPIFPALFIGGTAGVLVHHSIPRPATRADLHLHARRRARIPDSRAVRHGAAGRIPHGCGGAANCAHPDRRTHCIPHHGRHQILPHPPPTPSRSHGGETTPPARPTSRWSVTDGLRDELS